MTYDEARERLLACTSPGREDEFALWMESERIADLLASEAGRLWLVDRAERAAAGVFQ